MPDDLDRRIRTALDDVRAPDLWGEVRDTGRPERRIPRTAGPARRVIVAAFAFLVFAGSIGWLLTTRRDEKIPIAPPVPSADGMPPGGTSARSVGTVGALTCGVVMTGTDLHPGGSLGLAAFVRNDGAEPVRVNMLLLATTVDIVTTDGRAIVDGSDDPFAGPQIGPLIARTLRPGELLAIPTDEVSVTWTEPADVVATCFAERRTARLDPIPTTVVPTVGPEDRVTVGRFLEEPAGVFCTSSVPAVVRPGDPVGLSRTLENLSGDPVEVGFFPPSETFVVTGADGSSFDTELLTLHSWPFMPPEEVAAGASISSAPDEMPVQFPGPLTIEPRCHGEPMSTLTMQVDQRGDPIAPVEAISRAVDATEGLFDDCEPPVDGLTLGTLRVPVPDAPPPMVASCRARVRTYAGFAVVDLVAITPPPADGEEPRLGPMPIVPWSHDLPPGPNVELIVWRYVVTVDATTPAGSLRQFRTRPRDAMAPEWSLGPDGWSGPGGSRCGGEGAGGGWGGGTVAFIDVCAGGE